MKKNSHILLACSLMLLPSFCYAQSSGQNQREEAPAQVLAVGDSVEVLGLLGDYKGKLDVGAVSLNLVLHIYGDKNVTLDSPDQGGIRHSYHRVLSLHRFYSCQDGCLAGRVCRKVEGW